MNTIKAALAHIRKNWKTSVQSFLTVVVSLTGGLTVAPNPWISTTLAAKLFGAGSIAKVVLGLMQSDGGKQVNVTLPPGTELHQDTTIQTPKE